MNTNLRYISETPIDSMGKFSNMLNMAVKGADPKFTNDKNIVGQLYDEGAYTFNYNEDIQYKYAGKFTICFWFKLVNKNHVDEAYPNTFKLFLNSGAIITGELPASTLDCDWHWAKINRDNNNLITIQVDNDIIAQDTSTEEFNLSDNSYIFLGNVNRYFTGYDIITDDILIFEDKISYTDNKPTSYLDLHRFVKLIYVKSDGTVWAMREA